MLSGVLPEMGELGDIAGNPASLKKSTVPLEWNQVKESSYFYNGDRKKIIF
jgi:hypothetical protein